MLTEALINDFATRSFRNTADHDYISARLSYRHGLIEQFHWQALQAIEKYLKAILLYNRIEARNVRHDLAAALKRILNCPFQLDLSDSSRELISHIDQFAEFRYLEQSYYIRGAKLFELDRAVWEIRRYCRVLDYDLEEADGTRVNMLDMELRRIDEAKKRPPQEFSIIGGELEGILRKRGHPARSALIWQNIYFGASKRCKARQPVVFKGVNAPLTLHPEILDEVVKYVFLPKRVVDAYRSQIKTQ